MSHLVYKPPLCFVLKAKAPKGEGRCICGTLQYIKTGFFKHPTLIFLMPCLKITKAKLGLKTCTQAYTAALFPGIPAPEHNL